jgi:hypothetical protein
VTPLVVVHHTHTTKKKTCFFVGWCVTSTVIVDVGRSILQIFVYIKTSRPGRDGYG